MPPRVRLGRAHGRSNTPRHEIQAGADLSPRQPALRRSHKFTAPTEFCKRLNGYHVPIIRFVPEIPSITSTIEIRHLRHHGTNPALSEYEKSSIRTTIA